MHKQLPRAKGFTLVELLVVIAIIALIIGILLPSIASARAQSKFVACGVNLRTIGQMLHAYAVDNEDRIPRGPSFNSVNDPLFTPFVPYFVFGQDIATSQIWTTQYDAAVCPCPAGVNCHCCPDNICPNGTYPAEYMGLGLLTKKPGKIGNEFLFCPDDGSLNLSEEGPKIGDPNQMAFGSYLYRQMDIMPPQIMREGKLDNLQACDFIRPLISATLPETTYRLDVHALALDSNSLGTAEAGHLNHNGKKVNVLYKDGSVQPFDNEKQETADGKPPWASIPSSAFATAPAGILYALDRIFVAADYSYVNAEPWYAPVP
ncbi:MAG: prepilin-type N-terminal cleavage/methylation domain-containing protein [Planctomycetota bacterium]|nr:prepilin-type N-terminal cleavage/methylation domain-containing protein [Planctomycetota bacterium]